MSYQKFKLLRILITYYRLTKLRSAEELIVYPHRMNTRMAMLCPGTSKLNKSSVYEKNIFGFTAR